MTSKKNRVTGSLYVVGTPIGNLKDLSPRAREVLGDVEVVAAEDTRRTRGLLSSIAVHVRLITYNEHNEEKRAAELLGRLLDGESVALVSDAGMPLISDPGWVLVRKALDNGINVLSVPGPSAITAALSVAGLPTDRFVFEGFLPRRKDQRAKRLESLDAESRTMVFFEAVHRLSDTLAALAKQFGAERQAVIARELTKLHETVYSGSIEELSGQLGTAIPLLGEFVIAVAGRRDRSAPEDSEVRRIFSLLSEELPPDKAVSLSAEIAGISRNAVYRLTRVKK